MHLFSRPLVSIPLRRRVVWVACMLAAGGANPCLAQATAFEATPPTPPQGTPPPSPAPIQLEGDQLHGHTGAEVVLEGEASLHRADTRISADSLQYNQADGKASAIGNVRIERNNSIYQGPQLLLQMERYEGFFDQPSYQFLQNDAHGEASRADFVDQYHTVVHDATYTTCKRLPQADWLPDWILRATTISLDTEEEAGLAEGAYVSFKGVPILPIPALSFPLTAKRKSGLLPVSIGVDSVSGTQIAQPFYWNIAPNLDATITPTLLTNRGVDMGGQFRYLQPSYSGTVQGNYMAADSLRGIERWSMIWTHDGVFDLGVAGLSPLALDLHINRESDDNYWSDFSRTDSNLTPRLLPGEMSLRSTWQDVALRARVSRWQTLQDSSSPIVEPFNRVPQLNASYATNQYAGLNWSLEGDYTRFEADQRYQSQPDAHRIYGLSQLSYSWRNAQGFITPKVQLHTAAYHFDNNLANGTQSASSTVPTVSLDSGLVFERETSLLGQDVVQTLEPRAFYVYTPFRNQSQLPNYDTGANDYNFASIYTENAFSGHDKIADNNLLTLGLTSRVLDAKTGAQMASFGVAQRLRFVDQQVTLDSTTSGAQSGISDVLLGTSLAFENQWNIDATVQYNVRTDTSERSTLGGSYHPSPYRVVNAAYRYQRDQSEQFDVSWQWPINGMGGERGANVGAGQGQGIGRYYAVGRLNYSLKDYRMVDSVIGVEYDAGCWLGRVVFSRTQTSTSTATERVMFQIEFVGFTRVGVDPMSTLTQNIARYQNLRN